MAAALSERDKGLDQLTLQGGDELHAGGGDLRVKLVKRSGKRELIRGLANDTPNRATELSIISAAAPSRASLSSSTAGINEALTSGDKAILSAECRLLFGRGGAGHERTA